MKNSPEIEQPKEPEVPVPEEPPEVRPPPNKPETPSPEPEGIPPPSQEPEIIPPRDITWRAYFAALLRLSGVWLPRKSRLIPRL